MGSRFFQIRQSSLLKQLNVINDMLRRLKNTKKNIDHKCKILWQQNKAINCEIIKICKDILKYAQFWTPMMTVYFLCFYGIQCYLAYIVFFNEQVSFYMKSIFLYGFIEMNIALFLLIDQCARIVKINRAIEKANRKFYLLFRLQKSFRKISTSQILKVLFFT